MRASLLLTSSGLRRPARGLCANRRALAVTACSVQTEILVDVRRGGDSPSDRRQPRRRRTRIGAPKTAVRPASIAAPVQAVLPPGSSGSDDSATDQSASNNRGRHTAHVPVLAIEAGVPQFWRAYTGFDGDVLASIACESAPAAHVAEISV